MKIQRNIAIRGGLLGSEPAGNMQRRHYPWVSFRSLRGGYQSDGQRRFRYSGYSRR